MSYETYVVLGSTVGLMSIMLILPRIERREAVAEPSKSGPDAYRENFDRIYGKGSLLKRYFRRVVLGLAPGPNFGERLVFSTLLCSLVSVVLCLPVCAWINRTFTIAVEGTVVDFQTKNSCSNRECTTSHYLQVKFKEALEEPKDGQSPATGSGPEHIVEGRCPNDGHKVGDSVTIRYWRGAPEDAFFEYWTMREYIILSLFFIPFLFMFTFALWVSGERS